MTIRKVSEFQVTIAAMILGGARAINWVDVGCGRDSWRTIRLRCHLRGLTAEESAVTPEAEAWAKEVQQHQEGVTDRRRVAPADKLTRKIQRAARAGLIL